MVSLVRPREDPAGETQCAGAVRITLVIAEERGTTPEDVGLSQLGRGQRIVADKDNTAIIGGQGERGKIDDRVRAMRKKLEAARSDYDLEKLKERLAKLFGGIAVTRI